MTLTDNNINYIATNLEFYEIKDVDLKEDLIDHICTHIECYNGTDWQLLRDMCIGGYYDTAPNAIGFYEEAIWWNISNKYIQGVNINVNNVSSTISDNKSIVSKLINNFAISHSPP
jgi:hypothetical protein